MKNTFKAIILIGAFLLSGCASSVEYFYLTHYEAAFPIEDGYLPPVDGPDYAPTIIFIDSNRIGIFESDCNGEISEILPFSQGRVFAGIVDEAGGDKAFRKFLKTKIHTDMNQWKKRYITIFPTNKSEILACPLLQHGIIFRSANEIIITDTQYFYRFLLGKKPIY